MMKKNIIKAATGFLAALSLTITGCSNFLDVNENPNKPTSADPSLILPSTQTEIALVLGNHFQVYGGIWNQYWTQNFGNSQFKSIEQYLVQASDFDRPWQSLYADAMTDAQLVIDLNGQERYRQYAAISLLLKAFDLQMVTDAWGNVPLKDALKGVSEEIISPHYDKQEDIYDSIFAMIDKAKGWIEPGSDFLPGPEDVIFGGDMEQWTRFANTLKLRAYLRLAYVAPQKAKDGIEALENEGAEFLEQSAQIVYGTTGGNNNPLYAELFALGQYRQLRASNTLFKQMQYRNDPRIASYFQQLSVSGSLIRRGMDQASYDVGPNGSTPTPIFGADPLNPDAALAPVKFISSYESYFLQAEAAARGWLSGNAANLFRQGIEASFTEYETDPGSYITDRVATYPTGGAIETQVDSIITQKYFALALNQNFEAWTDWRRTGYPSNFFVKPVTGTLPAGTYPSRFLYPNSELTRNPNFPGAAKITDKVWWDVKD